MSEIFTATVAKNLETPLAQELKQLGMQRVVEDVGAVHFRGPITDGYTACLWSRISSRILLRLHRFQLRTPEDLYDGVQEINWADHLSPKGSIWIDFVGRSKEIRHSQFGARKAKDAIVDQLRSRSGHRPTVQKQHPDLRIHIHLRHNVATIGIDLCGQPLHQRSHNRKHVDAPLKENLAAALLQIANWPKRAKKEEPFVDPMCGSGTLLIEAGHILQNRPAGLQRKNWGFSKWLGHIPKKWENIKNEAIQRHEEGKAKKLLIWGMDINPYAIQASRHNLSKANLKTIKLSKSPLSTLRSPSQTPGLIMMNPPYGERLESGEDLFLLYRTIGDTLRNNFLGWDGYVLTTNELSKKIGLKTKQRHILFNGPLECRLLFYPIATQRPTQSLSR